MKDILKHKQVINSSYSEWIPHLMVRPAGRPASRWFHPVRYLASRVCGSVESCCVTTLLQAYI
ncbi:hypothetical protein EYF80_029749 [Liparis tanakae]|uniref:Uncharacterized protein n=1 Tax=Liparis tanakae TaxID=230148 RepID=A0A4Z2H3N2_9TELE|nr:hypothetical protein EYF80_029749 [Liparis tanakae]